LGRRNYSDCAGRHIDKPNKVQMILTKNLAMIVVAAITGFSPMGVMLVQDHLERQELASGEINKTVLLNHSLFTHADTWLQLVIPQLDVTVTAKKFLTIKFAAFQDSLKDLVKATDFNELSDSEMHTLLSHNLNETVTDYLADARRGGIPSAFIDNFNRWHKRVVDILVRAIEDNVKSVVHTSQNGKMYAILTAYDAALGATIDDVEKTLLEINEKPGGE
jgi:hypothetical protein